VFELLRRCGLRPPAAAGRGAARHPAGAVVAEICLLRAAAGVRIGQAQGRALSFTDFFAAIVANQNGLTSQLKASFCALISTHPNEIRRLILRRCAGLANPPRTKQRKECALFGIEVDITGADDA
jgi:hypothetical protein